MMEKRSLPPGQDNHFSPASTPTIMPYTMRGTLFHAHLDQDYNDRGGLCTVIPRHTSSAGKHQKQDSCVSNELSTFNNRQTSSVMHSQEKSKNTMSEIFSITHPHRQDSSATHIIEQDSSAALPHGQDSSVTHPHGLDSSATYPNAHDSSAKASPWAGFFISLCTGFYCPHAGEQESKEQDNK